MLNKILIKMIMKELLEDTFMLTFIKPTYDIEKKGKYYKITIIATLTENTIVSTKYTKLSIENWVELIISYGDIKKRLSHILIDNLKEDKQC